MADQDLRFIIKTEAQGQGAEETVKQLAAVEKQAEKTATAIQQANTASAKSGSGAGGAAEAGEAGAAGAAAGLLLAAGAGVAVGAVFEGALNAYQDYYDRRLKAETLFNAEIAKQVAGYRDLAAAASSAADVDALRVKIARDVADSQQKYQEAMSRAGADGKIEETLVALRSLGLGWLETYQTGTEAEAAALSARQGQREIFAASSVRLAEKQAAEIKRIEALSLDEQAAAYGKHVEELKERMQGLQDPALRVSLGKLLGEYEKRLEKVRDQRGKEITDTAAAYKSLDAQLAQSLRPEDRLARLQEELERFRDQLNEQGESLGINLDFSGGAEGLKQQLQQAGAGASPVKLLEEIVSRQNEIEQLAGQIAAKDQQAAEAAQRKAEATQKALDAAEKERAAVEARKQAAAEEAAAETAILQAKLSGNDQLRIKLEAEEKARREIQSLIDRKVDDPALFEQIRKNAELQTELRLREQNNRERQRQNAIADAKENLPAIPEVDAQGRRMGAGRRRALMNQEIERRLRQVDNQSMTGGGAPLTEEEKARLRGEFRDAYRDQDSRSRGRFGGSGVANPQNNLGAIQAPDVFAPKAAPAPAVAAPQADQIQSAAEQTAQNLQGILNAMQQVAAVSGDSQLLQVIQNMVAKQKELEGKIASLAATLK